MTVTVPISYFRKEEPEIITYRVYQKILNNVFKSELFTRKIKIYKVLAMLLVL